tara:strand:+ start:179 stop:325 length:147 start_codon:yes stop_codon:yes gene_type:complete
MTTTIVIIVLTTIAIIVGVLAFKRIKGALIVLKAIKACSISSIKKGKS